MNAIDTGGFIDPCLESDRTLLDWFAGQAMVAVLSSDPFYKFELDKIAGLSYDYAAAMLAEKRKIESCNQEQVAPENETLSNVPMFP